MAGGFSSGFSSGFDVGAAPSRRRRLLMGADMVIVRQSTARTVTIGPVLDADGAAVTDAVIGDFKISKNGGAPAALNGSATLTHRNTGHYSLALTTSDLDTVGQAEIVIDDTTNACPVKEVTVVEEAVYDALYVASAPGYVANAPVNVAQFGGSNGTFSSGRPEVNTTHAAGTAWGSGAITSGVFASGAITAAAIAADAIGASELAADAVAEIQSGLSTLDAAGVRTAVGLGSANLDTQLGVIATDASTAAGNAADARDAAEAVKITTDKLDDTLEDNAGTYRFTSAALAEGPAGGGGGPTAGEIADAVWDEAQSGHTTSGTFGKYLDAAVSGVSTGGVSAGDIADAVWDEALAGHTGSGSAGERMGRIPNAAANAAGGLLTYGTSTGQINPASGKIPATLASGDVSGNVAADVKALNGGAAPVHTAGKLHVLDDSGNAVATQTTAAAVQAKTDNLPASPAAVGSAMTLASGAISDATFTVPSEGTSPPSGTVGKIHWSAGRLGLRRVVRDILNGVIKVYQSNGTTVQSSNAYSADDSTEDIAKAT